MTYVSMNRVPMCGCGDVEMLMWFCDRISLGPNKPCHAGLLLEKLLQKVQLWPVYLEPNQITRMVFRTYAIALRKHFNINPNGPLPRAAKYFPHYQTIRYITHNGVVTTLDMATEEFFIQGPTSRSVFMHSLASEMLPICVDADRVLTPDEIRNLLVPLGDVCNLLQSR